MADQGAPGPPSPYTPNDGHKLPNTVSQALPEPAKICSYRANSQPKKNLTFKIVGNFMASLVTIALPFLSPFLKRGRAESGLAAGCLRDSCPFYRPGAQTRTKTRFGSQLEAAEGRTRRLQGTAGQMSRVGDCDRAPDT